MFNSSSIFSLPFGVNVASKGRSNHNHALTSFSVNGKSIKISQHFFDKPIDQPRVIIDNRRAADITGLKVWACALPLTNFLQNDIFPSLEEKIKDIIQGKRSLRILELGSGTGILGLSVATLGVHVVLTDPAIDVNLSEQESSNTIDQLRMNLEHNRDVIDKRTTVEKLLWGNKDDIEYIKGKYETFDLIIGSDLLYDPFKFPSLLSTVVELSGTDTITIFGGTKRHVEKQLIPLASKYFDVSCMQLSLKNMYVIDFRNKR